jgi:hypothetical protein
LFLESQGCAFLDLVPLLCQAQDLLRAMLGKHQVLCSKFFGVHKQVDLDLLYCQLNRVKR